MCFSIVFKSCPGFIANNCFSKLKKNPPLPGFELRAAWKKITLCLHYHLSYLNFYSEGFKVDIVLYNFNFEKVIKSDGWGKTLMLKLVDNLGQNTYWTWIFKEILTEREKEKENEKEREKKGEEVGEGTKHMLERIKKNKETY